MSPLGFRHYAIFKIKSSGQRVAFSRLKKFSACKKRFANLKVFLGFSAHETFPNKTFFENIFLKILF